MVYWNKHKEEGKKRGGMTYFDVMGKKEKAGSRGEALLVSCGWRIRVRGVGGTPRVRKNKNPE